MIDDNDAALWQRDWIETRRVREAPQLTRVVVAVDPPASTHGDECGIVVAGRSEDNRAYVLADRSMGGLTPLGWAHARRRCLTKNSRPTASSPKPIRAATWCGRC